MRLLLSPITCILWLIVGSFAGGLAHRFMGGKPGGFVSDFLLGIVGSIVGGFILSFFGLNILGTGGSFINPVYCFYYVVVSTIGACILIVIGRAIMGRRV